LIGLERELQKKVGGKGGKGGKWWSEIGPQEWRGYIYVRQTRKLKSKDMGQGRIKKNATLANVCMTPFWLHPHTLYQSIFDHRRSNRLSCFRLTRWMAKYALLCSQYSCYAKVRPLRRIWGVSLGVTCDEPVRKQSLASQQTRSLDCVSWRTMSAIRVDIFLVQVSVPCLDSCPDCQQARLVGEVDSLPQRVPRGAVTLWG